MNLRAMIKEGNQASLQDCAKTLIFLCYHLHESLTKNELLMRNHQSRPTRSESFLKVNAISSKFMDVVMIVEKIPDTMVLIVIILRK